MLHEETKKGDSVTCLNKIHQASVTPGNDYTIVELEKQQGKRSFRVKILTDTGAPRWIHSTSLHFENTNIDEQHKRLNELSFADLNALEDLLTIYMEHDETEAGRRAAKTKLLKVQAVMAQRIIYIFG